MGFFSDLVKKFKPDNHEQYVEYLINELEKAKNNNDDILKREQDVIQNLEEKIESEQLRRENVERQLEQIQKNLESIAAKKTVEEDSSMKLLDISEDSQALEDASEIITKAKEEAQKILEASRKEAESYKRQAENEMIVQKYKLGEYVKAIENSRKKLLDSYKELGALLDHMPVQIQDVLSDQYEEIDE